nr:MAG TPA: hypothetical protein [Caudoviricetes sp.]
MQAETTCYIFDLFEIHRGIEYLLGARLSVLELRQRCI